MARIVWIARHGNREDFVDPQWGRTARDPHDPDLSSDGVMQAEALAQRLAREEIHHVFASPFLRALHTAHLCARALGVTLRIEEGLGEMLNPSWFPSKPVLESIERRARRFDSIDVEYRSVVVPAHPEAEDDVDERCGRGIRGMLAGCEGNLLLVGHGASCISTIRALCGEFPGIDISLCSLTRVVERGDMWELTSHEGTPGIDGM